jgi:hypothetical protein
MFICFVYYRINNEKAPEDRIISVLDWFLTSFHQIRKVYDYLQIELLRLYL